MRSSATTASARCPWGAGDPLLREYHDTEWGYELHGRDALYERLCLEAFQSGLSWLVILRKRPAFREAFAGFDAEEVAEFDDDDVERLLGDAGIVRNRQKIVAAIDNARAVLEVERDGPGWTRCCGRSRPTRHRPRPRPSRASARPRRSRPRWPRSSAGAVCASSDRRPRTR